MTKFSCLGPNISISINHLSKFRSVSTLNLGKSSQHSQSELKAMVITCSMNSDYRRLDCLFPTNRPIRLHDFFNDRRDRAYHESTVQSRFFSLSISIRPTRPPLKLPLFRFVSIQTVDWSINYSAITLKLAERRFDSRLLPSWSLRKRRNISLNRDSHRSYP